MSRLRQLILVQAKTKRQSLSARGLCSLNKCTLSPSFFSNTISLCAPCGSFLLQKMRWSPPPPHPRPANNKTLEKYGRNTTFLLNKVIGVRGGNGATLATIRMVINHFRDYELLVMMGVRDLVNAVDKIQNDRT